MFDMSFIIRGGEVVNNWEGLVIEDVSIKKQLSLEKT